jgi:hypothetical protein
VATVASWAYEARQAYLQRKLTHAPWTGPQLIADGLWTGACDSEDQPIPSDANLDLWRREVFPAYSDPDPQENKRRSLRDTLITNPECGPRLISAGLWTGRYDDAGLPIPTTSQPERRRA